MTTVLYPGSFDPFHLGHLDVIEQSVALFGEVVVGVMHNPTKPSGMFTLDERVEMIRNSIAYMPSVKVIAFGGLAVDAAREVGCGVHRQGSAHGWRFRGRAADGPHQPRRQRVSAPCICPANRHWSSISSRFIREIAHYGGDVSALVPPPVAAQLSRVHPRDEVF